LSTSAKKVFVYRQIDPAKLKEAAIHILTPQFYWIKKIDMAVADRKLLRIAPSVFGELAQSDQLHYLLLRSKEGRYLIAYAPQQIIDFYASHHLQPPEWVRFAQRELEQIEDGCVEVENGQGLVRIDGIWHWLRLPRGASCVQADKVLERLRPSGFRAPLRTQRDRAAHSTLTKLLAAALIALLGVGVAVYDAKKRIDELVSQRQQRLKSLGLPQTKLQLKSIYASLKQREAGSKEIANILALIDRAPWESETVRRVHIIGSKASITLSKEPGKALLGSLRRYFGSVNVARDEKGYRVEVEL